MRRKRVKPPEHLSAEMKGWWRRITGEWTLDVQHFHILQAACESWDRMTGARDLIRSEGAVITDRFGQRKAHPAIGIERDSRLAFVRCVRELSLTDDVMPESRPPAVAGRYEGRR